MLKLSNELLGETLFFWNKLFDKQEDIGETRGADFSDNDGCQFVSSRKGQKLKIRNILQEVDYFMHILISNLEIPKVRLFLFKSKLT